MPDEHDGVDGQMAQPGGISYKIGEERQVRVRHEKLGAKRVQTRVGRALDGWYVNGGVIHAKVITVDQYGESCHRQESQDGSPKRAADGPLDVGQLECSRRRADHAAHSTPG